MEDLRHPNRWANRVLMSTTNLTTALFDFHVASGAKMVPFAGYAMPIQYATGIVNEHNQVRQSAGIFDVYRNSPLIQNPELFKKK